MTAKFATLHTRTSIYVWILRNFNMTSEYPRNIHFTVLGSSFWRSSLGPCRYAVHPKIRKCPTLVFSSIRTSYRVVSIALVGHWLRKCTAVDNASAQKHWGRDAPDNMDLTISTRVRFNHSATPFVDDTLALSTHAWHLYVTGVPQIHRK